MNGAQKKHREWLAGYLRPLIGGEIEEVAATDEDGAAWPHIWVRLPTGEKCHLEISRDEEGNGPGFIFGIPNGTRR